MQAQCGRWHAPFNAFQAQSQVTGQNQICRAAIDTAIQSAHRHRPDAGQGIRHVFKGHPVLFRFAEATNVVAGTNNGFGLPCGVGRQDHHANLGILVHSSEVRQQSFQVVVFQPIALGRTVQGDGGDTVCNLQDR